MSSKKRRAKRLIARIVRMDRTQYMLASTWGEAERAQAFIGCMKALAKTITRRGLSARAIHAMGMEREKRGQPW